MIQTNFYIYLMILKLLLEVSYPGNDPVMYNC